MCFVLKQFYLMNLQAIIFDLDGVLADSEPLWNEIDGELLAHYGVRYSGEYKHEVLGKSMELSLRFYSEKFKIVADKLEMASRRRDIAAEYYAQRIPVFEATSSVLEQLSTQLPLGLATSSISELVLPFLERHDIRKFFAQITTGEEVKNGKPSPDIYLRAAKKLEIAPEHCLVVEDALAGVQAGKSAGMTVAAIPDPRFMDVTLYTGKADYILKNLDELPELVEKMRQ